MKRETKDKIANVIREAMDRIIVRRTKTDPFSESALDKTKPFGYRLVSPIVWKGSKFERSFVTGLGQGVFEIIGKIIAEETGAFAENAHTEEFRVCTNRINAINELLAMQRKDKKGRKPDWLLEVKHVLSQVNTAYQEVSIVSDLYIKRKDNTEEYYSFKTVKPNLDQAEIAKKDMLLLLAGDRNRQVYFGLPYNPAGEGELYKKAKHTIPYKIFEMDTDQCVLIGANLWNKLGQDPTTYDELLSVFSQVGESIKPRIDKEYFGVTDGC